MASTRRLAAIMFTDMVGYTASTQTNEARTLELLREQEKLVRPLLKTHKGREIKSTGDGFLAEFDSALKALQCAVDLQRRIYERNAQAGVAPFQIRIGIHLGDVEQRGTDILGDAVNIAARIEPVAEPGGICVSGAVHEQVWNKISDRLERLPPKALKGLQVPMDIYRVVLPWAAVTPTPAAHAGPPRLAVLPLVNISHDPENEYFADGLTEELISVISQVKGLRVISRTSVSQYKGVNKPVAQIGADLGVDSVLEGSVRKAGDRLRITVQLIETKTDEHQWTKTYDRKLEDVFAIQAEVAEETAGALKLHLLQSEREAIQERPTASLAAYESFLRGIQEVRKSWDREGPRDVADQQAVRRFEAAIAEDPKFSVAYSYLANHLLEVMGQSRPGKDVFPRVRELVAKALELTPNSSEAHLAQGNLAMQAELDWARAEAEFQQAIALNPSGSEARFWYGSLLYALQRYDEARKHFLTGLEQDPLWISPRYALAWLPFHKTGDLASTIASLEDLASRFPGNALIRQGLAVGYLLAGPTDDGMRRLGTLPAPVEPEDPYTRALVLGMLGRTEESRALLTEWEHGLPGRYVSSARAAILHALLGDQEGALLLLERDYREGDRALWAVYLSPWLDSIRDNPRFVTLLREMRLPTTLVRSWRYPGPR